MRIRVKYTVADLVDELLQNRVLVLDNGGASREIGKALAPLRKNGTVMVGYDQQLHKTIMAICGDISGKRRKKKSGFGSFVFDIM